MELGRYVINYKTNWKADRTANNDTFINARY